MVLTFMQVIWMVYEYKKLHFQIICINNNAFICLVARQFAWRCSLVSAGVSAGMAVVEKWIGVDRKVH
jgi:hypothetical protein